MWYASLLYHDIESDRTKWREFRRYFNSPIMLWCGFVQLRRSGRGRRLGGLGGACGTSEPLLLEPLVKALRWYGAFLLIWCRQCGCRCTHNRWCNLCTMDGRHKLRREKATTMPHYIQRCQDRLAMHKPRISWAEFKNQKSQFGLNAPHLYLQHFASRGRWTLRSFMSRIDVYCCMKYVYFGVPFPKKHFLTLEMSTLMKSTKDGRRGKTLGISVTPSLPTPCRFLACLPARPSGSA